MFGKIKSKFRKLMRLNRDLEMPNPNHHVPGLNEPLTSLEQLSDYSRNSPGFLRLHLGCGQSYFPGYVNIDYPPSEHTVMTKSSADLYADIRTLRFAPQTISEIRLHHLFEHFDRPTALRLLTDWHEWLIEGGILLIETPDFDACARIILNRWKSWPEKAVAMRHLFGSHEAHWAYHLEGWNKKRFRHTLRELGFVHLKFRRIRWKGTRNIFVIAEKDSTWPHERLERGVSRLLAESLVDKSERRLHEIWMEQAGCQAGKRMEEIKGYLERKES